MLATVGDQLTLEGQQLVTQVIVTDADKSIIELSLSGIDAAAFEISDSGVLTFAAIPDFEAPTDQDLDNVYELTVTASEVAGDLSDSESSRSQYRTALTETLLTRRCAIHWSSLT